MFNNVKGYETWYPQIAESKRLLQISEFRWPYFLLLLQVDEWHDGTGITGIVLPCRSINYMKFGLPVPFSDRDLVVYAFGADLLEEQARAPGQPTLPWHSLRPLPPGHSPSPPVLLPLCHQPPAGLHRGCSALSPDQGCG